MLYVLIDLYVLYFTVLYCIALYCFVFYCIVLGCLLSFAVLGTVLLYSALHHITVWKHGYLNMYILLRFPHLYFSGCIDSFTSPHPHSPHLTLTLTFHTLTPLNSLSLLSSPPLPSPPLPSPLLPSPPLPSPPLPSPLLSSPLLPAPHLITLAMSNESEVLTEY